MNLSAILIIAGVAIVLLALVAVLVVSMRRRSRADDAAKAAVLRERADERASGLSDLQAQALRAETDAEHKRAEADRAEERAVEARRLAQQEQAAHEDTIRAADRLDPAVDTRAPDYVPDTSAAEVSEAVGSPAAQAPDVRQEPGTVVDGTHRHEVADATHEPDTRPGTDDTRPGGTHRA